MGKCLITKLSGIINNPDILKFGELRVPLTQKTGTYTITVAFAKATKVGLIGNAHFISPSSEDLGKSIDVSANSNTPLRIEITGEGAILDIVDKYELTYFVTCETQLKLSDLKYCRKLAILDLGYSNAEGNLSELSMLTEMKILTVGGPKVSGKLSDISSLKKLMNLSLSPSNIYSYNIEGDLADIAGLTELKSLDVSNTKIKGDITSLQGLTKFSSLGCVRTAISGNINVLSNRPLTSLLLNDKIIIGDYAKLPDTVVFAFGGTSGCSWSTRTSPAKVICTNQGYSDAVTSDNVDKVLNDLASCADGFYSQSWMKTIVFNNVTRTTASDSAVANLQSRGYTVVINPK